MSNPTRVLIYGASGRMGQALLRLVTEFPSLEVVAAVSRRPLGHRPLEHPRWLPANALAEAPRFDVMIDFSLPEAFDPALALCVQRGAAFVSGTTGLDAAQQSALEAAAAGIPLVWASNFSLGVAVLAGLVERAAASLPGWDCDIVEAHHTRKKDAPSGTALTLGQAAGQGGASPHYASLRAGDIVGEHLVQFTGMGERIELVHRATNRDIFARGALHVASRLPQRAPGAYRVRDLLE